MFHLAARLMNLRLPGSGSLDTGHMRGIPKECLWNPLLDRHIFLCRPERNRGTPMVPRRSARLMNRRWQ
jgi:hypothetical protein